LFYLITDYSINQINNVNSILLGFITFFFEIIFDYIKDIIVFHVSYFDTKILKYISYEIPLYYMKLKGNLLTKEEEFLKDKK
jgi:accessory gene regulator protein AgrB